MRIARLISLLAALTPLLAATAGSSRADGPPFHELWRQGGAHGFAGWSLVGVRDDGGRLALDSATAADARARLAPLARADAVLAGSALGPERQAGEPFGELIPSWNAQTPLGTWIELFVRARVDGRWTAWYALGIWSSSGKSELRRSVAGQDDADARVLTDTLALRSHGEAYQLRIDLFSGDPSATPVVSLATLLASRRSTSPALTTDDGPARGVTLAVPERSQMVYPGGGEVWCSPTSTTMVMAYWSEQLGRPDLLEAVPDVAVGTYDAVYRGHGNWPFNTAYAARNGLVGYVSRLSSAAQLERWVASGVPVITSLAWGPGRLPNAPIASTDGHLLVVVGFAEDGDVVVNEPAADPRRGQSVRRRYPRQQFESLWLGSSGGTVYLIYPETREPPP